MRAWCVGCARREFSHPLGRRSESICSFAPSPPSSSSKPYLCSSYLIPFLSEMIDLCLIKCTSWPLLSPVGWGRGRVPEDRIESLFSPRPLISHSAVYVLVRERFSSVSGVFLLDFTPYFRLLSFHSPSGRNLYLCSVNSYCSLPVGQAVFSLYCPTSCACPCTHNRDWLYVRFLG